MARYFDIHPATPQQRTITQIADIVRATYGLDSVPPFAVEVAPNRALGDLAVPVAFQLAQPAHASIHHLTIRSRAN